MKIEERFIKYVLIDTASDANSKLTHTPSTKGQREFANILLNELHDFGIANAYVDEFGYVYAHFDGDLSKPKIGLIAHMDTVATCTEEGYAPQIIKNYDGSNITLCDFVTLSPDVFPSLKDHISQSLIVTDGSHILGGDDKAGIAIIMSLLEFYTQNPNIKHAPIRVCFTPDEEIGHGTDFFDIEAMDADFAYTLDGGKFNEVNYENFYTASCDVTILGVNIHTIYAKGVMENAISLGVEFNSLLPEDEVPEKASCYEGFYHLAEFTGEVEKAYMTYYICDYDYHKLQDRIETMKKIEKKLNIKYNRRCAFACITERYKKSMYEYFKNDMSVVNKILKAYHKNNFTVSTVPLRGGTDGMAITFMGLPCPNVGTGDYNCHSVYEYVSIDEMYNVFKVFRTLFEDDDI